jgi:hypothetical protein
MRNPWINIGGERGLVFNMGWYKGEDFSLLSAEALTFSPDFVIFFSVKVFKFCISFAYFK